MAKLTEWSQRNWPPGVLPTGGTQNDQTSSYALAGATLNLPVLIMAANSQRTYFAIQNNASGAISIGIGAPTLQGIILQPGGSYERWYAMTAQPFFAVPLFAPAATDFVTVDEGTMTGGM